jgi:hypothetical protein
VLQQHGPAGGGRAMATGPRSGSPVMWSPVLLDPAMKDSHTYIHTPSMVNLHQINVVAKTSAFLDILTPTL